VPNAEKPTYQGREVTLGPKVGDYYVVESGLAEGELVVTRGNFKIDAALQIQAKPSMMNPEGGAAPTGHQHGTGQMK
jgi:Cu(I)/Ag(I) efflux system membrane fusion protein